MSVVRDLEEVSPSIAFVNFLLLASVKCLHLCPGKKKWFTGVLVNRVLFVENSKRSLSSRNIMKVGSVKSTCHSLYY